MIVPDAKEKWTGRVNPVTIGATKAGAERAAEP